MEARDFQNDLIFKRILDHPPLKLYVNFEPIGSGIASVVRTASSLIFVYGWLLWKAEI